MRVLIRYSSLLGGVPRRVLGEVTRTVVRAALTYGQAPNVSETGVYFVDDGEIRELNRRYRSIDRSTDVLAFAMREGPKMPDVGCRGPELLGDIVVSLDAARRQALERGHSVRREVGVLLTHGALHLLGYDHPGGAARRREREHMRRAESAVLAGLEEMIAL